MIRQILPALYISLAAVSLSAVSVTAHGQDAVIHTVAADEDERDVIKEFLYEPEMVLKGAKRLNLSRAQKKQIIGQVTELQLDVLDLEDEAERAQEDLITAFSRDIVSEEEVMTAFDDLLAVERTIKREYVKTLVQVRNVLTAEQRAKLDAFKERRRRRRGL